MDKKIVQAVGLLGFLILLLLGVLSAESRLSAVQMELRVYYREFHANRDGGTAQLFYSENGEGFSEERSILCNMIELDNSVVFKLPDVDLTHTDFRFDPFMNEEVFSIRKVEIWHRGQVLWSMYGNVFDSYVSGLENCVYMEDEGQYVPLTADPILYLDRGFNTRIIDVWEGQDALLQMRRTVFLYIMILLFLMAGIFLFAGRSTEPSARMTRGHRAAVTAACVSVCLGLISAYALHYLLTYFGTVRLEELIFYLNMPLEGTNVSAFSSLFLGIGIAAAAGILLVCLGDRCLRKMGRHKGYPLWIGLLGLMILGNSLWYAYEHMEIASYIAFRNENSPFYEENYVDGREVELTFPQEKRNLIYIYMESMEATFADKESGGAMQENYIPELTELALDNIDFSAPGVLNGAQTVNGTTFTMGGIVAQTAGIPINTTIISGGMVNMWRYEDEDTYLLPGACTIGDLLAEQGYRQMFMIGSDGMFGGRSPYFTGHGNYEIFDYYTAIEEGKIPEDYYMWWGYEDARLMTYAKEKILELARGDEPFNFTMLTVDTHFPDGFWCKLCEDEFEEQYSNVLACASRQVYDLVEWAEQQEFWGNTTIVIAGDHLTMDNDYIENMRATSGRRVFFTIINPAQGCEEPERAREYTTLDFFPTTLAALGVQIEGEQMGLGVNLFSDLPTYVEQYGIDYLNGEVLKNSEFYAEQLLYGKIWE